MRTVLYLDDSPDDRILMETACRRAGAAFRLKTTQSAAEAIRYLTGEGEFANRAENPLPDLIFLDLKLPEMDGFGVLRWIRANTATRDIPVALYSGSCIAADIARGYAEGANYFIIKPTQFAALIEIVRAADQCLAANSKECEALARFAAAPQPQ